MLKSMPQQVLSKGKEYHIPEGIADKNIICASSGRQAGNMSLRYGDTASSLDNRKSFLGSLGIDYKNLVCAKQIHGSRVRYVTALDKGKGALSYDTAITDTDALVTDEKNLPLAVFTADCLAVFLYDPKNCAIGLVHAGWRSTKEKICQKTINFMRQAFNSDPADLLVSFGPCIRSCCYEVAGEFSEFFPRTLIKKGNGYYFDLSAENQKQITASGVAGSHMFDSGICSSCRNNDFFSYRKEGASCGRSLSVIMLR